MVLQPRPRNIMEGVVRTPSLSITVPVPGGPRATPVSPAAAATAVSRHGLLALTVGLGVWVYATATDVALVYPEEIYSGLPVDDLPSRWTQHLLLLPLLSLGFLAAARLYRRPPSHWLTAWALQALIGLAYAAACWPARLAGVALVHGSETSLAVASAFVNLAPGGFLLHWAGIAASELLHYLLGVSVLMAMLTALDLAEERARRERLHAEWLQARLRTLQSEINPHFMFNSLNTVSSLLRSSPGRAEQVLARFSELLRVTLREQKKQYSSVDSELEYLHRYLDLEKVRFEDRLRLSIEADEDALGGRVPSLLLQPLVENAIKHGVARVPGPASVELSVMRHGSRLVMQVRNSSSGDAGTTRASAEGTGLGLDNLRSRLAALYPGAFHFESLPEGHHAWVSVVDIPYVPHSSGYPS